MRKETLEQQAEILTLRAKLASAEKARLYTLAESRKQLEKIDPRS